MKKTIKIILGIGVVVIIGVVSYFALIEKPLTILPPGEQGAYIPSEEEIIRVLFPKGGEKLEIGKTYEVSWENYIGDEPLSVGLQVTTPNEKTYVKHIATNVPAALSGVYKWTVTSERTDSKYKVEVYPEENRPLVGRSKDYFSITGDSLIVVNTPQPLEKVTTPIKVSGRARRIFSEGEFIIRLRAGGAKWDEDNGVFVKFPPIAEAMAWAKTGDWMSGDWCDFEVELSISSEELKDNNWIIEFYQRDERFGEKLIYEFLVVGEQSPAGHEYLQISSPLHNQEVISPMVITGKAKGIFVDGKFRVALWGQDYPYGHPKDDESRLIDSTYATIINGNCDWSTGVWCDFRAEVSYQPSEVGKEGNTLNFYRGGKGELGEGFLLTWPIKIKQ
ncbi:Gmad2 immunoglobulin-like domain-containing protein [Patescibacteria group bacterium]|nr:Gmad2 immunoglobulin-like domain-containing protein [Patescibacteria group bacterium]MBU4078489.1 Gmad2 immunoglobulin-like domain-containing protein [Patescibacteria group bacterium]